MRTTMTRIQGNPAHENFPVVTPMHMPKPEQSLVVELPGERLLATVAKVVSPDIVIVELTSMPMSKSHQHKKGEFVPVERHFNGLETCWREYSMMPKSVMPKVEVPSEAPAKKRRSGGKKVATKKG